MMYLIGFLGGWWVLSRRLLRSSHSFTQEQLSDMVFYAALGAIVGGRVGYMLFYDTATLLSQPLILLQPWKGGMSFHGGLLGVLFAMQMCAKRMHKPFLVLTDFLAPAVPIGLGAGRIGNFINGELWGRVTDVPWSMVFPYGGPLPRHPSQLYEFLLEGVVLFVILWSYSRQSRPIGAVSGLFALLYGVFRSIIEYYREPDAHIGYLAFGWLTEGQLLSLPLILIGCILLIFAYSYKREIIT
jgi:phosphatidylglycerol:prolipoprotein diacylglycerol transferase